MSQLERFLDPRSIAIVGLSADERKHGGRVLGHLRRLGYEGGIWGVNPNLPDIEGVSVYASVQLLPEPPDLVVAAVPAPNALQVVEDSIGVGAVVVFAAGFAEAGSEGVALQAALAEAADAAGTRVLGPNSGGLIRPGRGVAASFLTCLDRPAEEIRSGPVAVVTQSGGIGSYLHNLAAARHDGLAVSIATGNETDIALGEAVAAVSRLDEVKVVVAIIEALRDGEAFIDAVGEARGRGKRVVACRIGTGARGASLMASHTGAMASSPARFEGVFASLGVVNAETPAEAYEVATVLAATSSPAGPRVGIITHSGGTAILLADLAERCHLTLPSPSQGLKTSLEPLLDHGVADNPLDMGGIIGGPSRFAEVVERVARSGEVDLVMAVSTAHPPGHTGQRVTSLLALDSEIPIVHLWMAGDQGADGLAALRSAGAAVTEEPRAAVRAVAALAAKPPGRRKSIPPVTGPLDDWGLPLDEGWVAATEVEAVEAAGNLGYPVVVKAEAPGLVHKTEVGGVGLDLRGADEVKRAFAEVVGSVAAAGWSEVKVRVQRYRSGLEMIVGGITDESFGPIVSIGMGGVLTEVMKDVAFAPGPVDEPTAHSLIERLRARPLLEGFRGAAPADLDELARIISVVSRAVGASGMREVEINPLIWEGERWVAVDWFVAQ